MQFSPGPDSNVIIDSQGRFVSLSDAELVTLTQQATACDTLLRPVGTDVPWDELRDKAEVYAQRFNVPAAEVKVAFHDIFSMLSLRNIGPYAETRRGA